MPVGGGIRTRAWYNPNLESKYYFVPGLIAVMLILIGLVLASMAIVREKEIGIRILRLPIGAQVILAASFLILTVSRFRKP